MSKAKTIGGRKQKFDNGIADRVEADLNVLASVDSAQRVVSGMACFATQTVGPHKWTHLIHVPTGRSVYLFETRELAQKAAGVLAEMDDWSEGIPSDLDRIMHGILDAGFYPSGAFDGSGSHVWSWYRRAATTGRSEAA
ncbi:hypothetical protein W911_06810 [Hyphomicrobium nitrativorans NL23]|uniref:Uncharacterized protein n=1 Tax=Hyphomicrobium nitrativorans NL23 TaxID=1029756 RepID=V5SHT0_9HYPH|nr:hypothetical protein [Hyphomicrobium nitrativorans]AHB50057.1 hypothetical protein W911_06810 [Hyphomicrobium nitrativorans NL23]